MKNPCLIISDERPSIVLFSSKFAAVAAGVAWASGRNGDRRWQVVDLEVVTVIWGDDEVSGPGVFNFTPVELSGPADQQNFGELARRAFYEETSRTDPESLLVYDEGDDSGTTDIGRPMTVEEYLETPYTLISVLPGRLDEIAS